MPRREFKAGRIENALEMFSKGLRYMDQHPVVPEDQPEELKNTFESLYVLTSALPSLADHTQPVLPAEQHRPGRPQARR